MGWLRTVISTVWLLVAARIAVGRAYAAWTDRQRKRLAATLPSGSSETGTAKCVIGFFHPYWSVLATACIPTLSPSAHVAIRPGDSNAGGGGERVLWTALARMQLEKGTSAIFAVYTGDAGPGKASKEEILAKAQVNRTFTRERAGLECSLAFPPGRPASASGSTLARSRSSRSGTAGSSRTRPGRDSRCSVRVSAASSSRPKASSRREASSLTFGSVRSLLLALKLLSIFRSI